jgi:F0F1-type ATP synthase membrane subunit a
MIEGTKRVVKAFLGFRKHQIHSMASLGRLLQIVGLVLPPLSIILQLQGAITLGQMLTMLVAAVSAFWIGRIVEGYARR